MSTITLSTEKLREWLDLLAPYHFDGDRNNEGVLTVCDELEELVVEAE